MLTFKTAGESHGKAILALLDGLPAGIKIDLARVNNKLALRQKGYGRGGRMKIEKDRVEVISGLRFGETIGSPLTLLIENKDWVNWQEVMSSEELTGLPQELVIKDNKGTKLIPTKVTRPRPGHADLAGALKYNTRDVRNILERASARETAARTAVGGVLDCFLSYFGIEIISHLVQLGPLAIETLTSDFQELKEVIETSPLRCFDGQLEKKMLDLIEQSRKAGDSLGGIIEIRTTPLPLGLGSHVQWDRRLDGLLAQALLSIPAIKGLEIGPAFENAAKPGSQVHDEIFYTPSRGFYRKTNRAGGLEGGMTNGQPLIIRMAMKPIPTLDQPLQSVDLEKKEVVTASVERADVTAVLAAGVVGEAMVAFVLARAILEKFGGDHLKETLENYQHYLAKIKEY